MDPTMIDALAVRIPLEPLPAEKIARGAPETGSVTLETRDGLEIGVWEHTVGVSIDVETDEWFTVLGGEGILSFDPPRGMIELRPGVTVRLAQGERTVWNVRATLRKLYVSL